MLVAYGLRANALCPWCGSLERTRRIAMFLSESNYSILLKGKLVLHIAPKECLKRFITSMGAKVITVDVARHKVMAQMDLHDLGIKSNSIDWIICVHVLEHLRDDKKCLKELKRVLRSDGMAILDSPFDESLAYTTEFEAPDKNGHWRQYGWDFYDGLVKAGFMIVPKWKDIVIVSKQG